MSYLHKTSSELKLIPLNTKQRGVLFMKTEVILKREILGGLISQKSKNGFFSATDLIAIGNKWRIKNELPLFSLKTWLRSNTTKDFVIKLENEYGIIRINSTGKNSHTWIHPLLFIDLALAINPELKLKVYQWIYDDLIKYRNDSGDSYKKMCGSLYDNSNSKSSFQKEIHTVAMRIQEACGELNWNKATESNLLLRDKIHNNISFLVSVLKDNKQAIRLGIEKTLEDNK